MALASADMMRCNFCQATEGDPLKVPCRYGVSPAASGLCNFFLPNQLSDGQVLK